MLFAKVSVFVLMSFPRLTYYRSNQGSGKPSRFPHFLGNRLDAMYIWAMEGGKKDLVTILKGHFFMAILRRSNDSCFKERQFVLWAKSWLGG